VSKQQLIIFRKSLYTGCSNLISINVLIFKKNDIFLQFNSFQIWCDKQGTTDFIFNVPGVLFCITFSIRLTGLLMCPYNCNKRIDILDMWPFPREDAFTISQSKTWISNVICYGLFYVHWFKVRGDCSYHCLKFIKRETTLKYNREINTSNSFDRTLIITGRFCLFWQYLEY
jgi:hypothetical protein